MLVFFEEKLVIFATTKTGSTALQGALTAHASLVLRNPPGLKHIGVSKYQRILEPTLHELGAPKDTESFALIRHPVDWLSSWFRYRCRDKLVGKPTSTRDVTFNEFVLETLKDKPAPFAQVGTQSSFLIGQNGELGIDHLFQYEAQPTYLKFLGERLSREITLKQRNVSPQFNVNLDPKIRRHLESQIRLDFDLWNIAQS